MSEAGAEPGLPPPGAAFRTVLAPERQSLLPFALLSAVFHVAAAGSMWGITGFVAVLSAFAPQCSPPQPVIQDALEVSVVSLPKSATKVPDRAARVDRASGEVKAETPPPVKEDDLAFKSKAPDPKKGNIEDAKRQQLLDEIKRQQLLDEMMDAPDGPQDRDATDPNGTSDDPALAALSVGSKGDPEFQRWQAQVQQILKQHFKPISAITEGRQDLACQVSIDLDPQTGQIRDSTVTGPSGVLLFDQAAERAVSEVPSLPLPPEKYLPLLAQGVTFRFTPP